MIALLLLVAVGASAVELPKTPRVDLSQFQGFDGGKPLDLSMPPPVAPNRDGWQEFRREKPLQRPGATDGAPVTGAKDALDRLGLSDRFGIDGKVTVFGTPFDVDVNQRRGGAVLTLKRKF